MSEALARDATSVAKPLQRSEGKPRSLRLLTIAVAGLSVAVRKGTARPRRRLHHWWFMKVTQRRLLMEPVDDDELAQKD
jgi:hypothetical protein